MKIAMIGVGGIGGYYAARLIDAGHQLVLVARGEQLQALQENGLTVKHSGWNFHSSVSGCSFEEFCEQQSSTDFDLVCLAVKAQSSKHFAQDLANWFSESGHCTAVISLQNGVDSEPVLAHHLGSDCVIGALAVGIGAHIVRPGVIESKGHGKIVMGIWPTMSDTMHGPARNIIAPLAQAFSDASIPTETSDDIRRELWRKLIINNGVNPLSALTGLDTRSLTRSPEFQPIVHGLMLETVAAAKADDVQLEKSAADDMLRFMQEFDAIKTSMLVDHEKGRPLEIDPICGAVLQRSEQLGLDAPYTRTVYSLLNQQAG